MAISPLLFKYKGNRCANCGLTVEEMLERWGVVNKVFQFNHVDPAKKDSNYDNLIQRVISPEQLDEVDKCILLCNNCHDILHAQRGTATLHFKIKYADRVVEQHIKGQTIFDMQTKMLRFFSDDPYLLSLHAVVRGDSEPEILTGLDLYEGLFLEYLLGTRVTGKLKIWQNDKKWMLTATKLNDRICRVDVSDDFSLLKFNGMDDETGKPKMSVRNNQIIFNPKDKPEQNPIPASGSYDFHVNYATLRTIVKQMKDKQKGDRSRPGE